MPIFSVDVLPSGDSLWTFLATVAFIVQMILQRRWAQQAATKATEAAAKLETATTTAAAKMEKATATAAVQVAQTLTTAGEKTAARLTSVKETLAAATEAQNSTLAEIKDTGDKNHALLNGGHGEALKANVLLARRVADLTGNAADAQAVVEAQATSDAHEARLTKVDRGG